MGQGNSMVRRISNPIWEWFWMSRYSYSLIFPGLLRISAGMEILPRSWMEAAIRMASMSSGESFISVAMARARSDTRFWWPAVYGSRVSMVRDMAWMVAPMAFLSRSSVRPSSSSVRRRSDTSRRMTRLARFPP